MHAIHALGEVGQAAPSCCPSAGEQCAYSVVIISEEPGDEGKELGRDTGRQ